MEFDWLKDFAALVETKSFSRAADMRNVTQPAFSRRIRALEEWVGTALFARGAQGASLTPAGAHFMPAAAELLRTLERMQRETRAVGEGSNSALSIAATHALSFTFVPRWLRGFMQTGALGAINLISDSMEACEEIMLAGEAHFLIGHFHPSMRSRLEPRFESIVVGEDVLTPYCAPGADGAPLWPLSGAAPPPRLAYSEESGLGRILAAAPAASETPSPAVFTSHLAATLATMAREGHGVAWLPRTMAGEDVASGRLMRAGGEKWDIFVEIRLFRSGERRNAAADQLWDQLTEPLRAPGDNRKS